VCFELKLLDFFFNFFSISRAEVAGHHLLNELFVCMYLVHLNQESLIVYVFSGCVFVKDILFICDKSNISDAWVRVSKQKTLWHAGCLCGR